MRSVEACTDVSVGVFVGMVAGVDVEVLVGVRAAVSVALLST